MKASPPQYDILHSTQPVNAFIGGQGTGKTFVLGMVSKSYVDNFPNVRGLIAANTYGQLTRSTLFRVREFWRQCMMFEYNDTTGKGDYVIGKMPPSCFNTDNHNYDNYSNIISCRNGCVIYIGSLDNYKTLDGMEVGWALLDETKDTKEEAIKEVILGRIRQPGIWISDKGKKTPHRSLGVKAFNPLYIFTSPAKVPWINEWFNLDEFEPEIMEHIFIEGDYFKKKFDDKLVTISSVYMNKENLPDGFIERQKNNLPSHLHDMLIYGSPFSKAGGEFYKCFDRSKHVGEVKYDPELPLHITFDFNVNPYMTLIVTQIDKDTDMGYTRLNIIEEICLANPDNTTRATCNRFKATYFSHRSGVFVYGDPAGKARDTRSEDGYNDFDIIAQVLSLFRPRMRVASSAPSIVMRGNFINSIFETQYDGLQVMIGDNCPKTIADFTFLQEDSDGRKKKKKVTDPNTKISYEEYGHITDALDYLICEAFKAEFRKFQRRSDKVDYSIQKRTSHKW